MCTCEFLFLLICATSSLNGPGLFEPPVHINESDLPLVDKPTLTYQMAHPPTQLAIPCRCLSYSIFIPILFFLQTETFLLKRKRYTEKET